MNQITIIIQSNYVVYDDLGQPMAQGEIHVVNDTPVIEDLISNGQASIVDDVAPPVAAQETMPKAATQSKNSKNQETVSTSPTGEI
jgi:hypothetical protein